VAGDLGRYTLFLNSNSVGLTPFLFSGEWTKLSIVFSKAGQPRQTFSAIIGTASRICNQLSIDIQSRSSYTLFQQKQYLINTNDNMDMDPACDEDLAVDHDTVVV